MLIGRYYLDSKLPKKSKYVIPKWCRMPNNEWGHKDGIGGCWGISYGYVAKKGQSYCNGKLPCEYYKKS